MEGHEANGDNLGIPFQSSIMVCCVYSLELPR